jgi:ABC-type uncharacterized transport system permease subunit
MIALQDFLAYGESTLLLFSALLYLAAMLGLWTQLFFRSGGKSGKSVSRFASLCHGWLWGGCFLHLAALFGQGSAVFSLRDGVVGLFGWGLLLTYLVFGGVMARMVGTQNVGFQKSSLGAFVVPVILVATLYSLAAPALHPAVHSASLQKPWLFVHVVSILISYVALAFAFVSSLLYLLQDNLLKRKKLTGLWQKLPSLQVADDWIFRGTSFGFAALTLGLLTGMLWMRLHPGYAYMSDPKVLISLATWVTFAIYLAARRWLGWRGRKSNWVVVGGFILIAISFLGTPHLLNGIS